MAKDEDKKYTPIINAVIFFGDNSVTLARPIGEMNNSPVVIRNNQP